MNFQARSSILFLLHLGFCSSESISSYFLRLEFQELDVMAIKNDKSHSDLECLMKCNRLPECKSVNFAVKPRNDGWYRCILLRIKAANGFDNHLKPSPDYHHLTRLALPCVAEPCENGGQCVLDLDIKGYDYVCNCTGGYAGPNCEKKCILFDFETGRLDGWTLTGTAFNNQPTYGDNPTARKREPSNHQGNWWIGTFENRSSPSHMAGATQSDSPLGTMTSPPFIIQGTKIKFLIGGGSDITTERVELLIGGTAVAKATGAKTETMTQKVFDVTSYRGQTAQLRVVDSASRRWGHINVDHFEDSICTE